MIKGCKSIAEYAFRRWMADHDFVGNYFSLEVAGNKALIKDEAGNTLGLVYDSVEKCVNIDG